MDKDLFYVNQRPSCCSIPEIVKNNYSQQKKPASMQAFMLHCWGATELSLPGSLFASGRIDNPVRLRNGQPHLLRYCGAGSAFPVQGGYRAVPVRILYIPGIDPVFFPQLMDRLPRDMIPFTNRLIGF
jgi:hypothetical protein